MTEDRIRELAVLFGLRHTPAVALERLDRHPGRIVSRGELQEALEAATGSGWSMISVATPVKFARRGIAGRGVITTRYSMGYQLHWIGPRPVLGAPPPDR